MRSMDSCNSRGRGFGSQGGRRQNRSWNSGGDSRVQLSKRLTWALRHGAKELGLRMRSDGFVRLDELLGNTRFRGVSTEQVQHVVSADEKGRMSIIFDRAEGDGLLIRANQGHSIEGVIIEEQLLTRVDRAEDIPICVHGTFLSNWPRIRESGLRRMNRTHIHFAVGLPGVEGVVSGMRRDCQVFIYVDVALAMTNGITFFRSSNNVILTSGIEGTLDTSYFSRVEGVSDWNPEAVPPEGKALEASAADGQNGTSLPIAGTGEVCREGTRKDASAAPTEASRWRRGHARAREVGVDVYAILGFEATCEDRAIDERFGPPEIIEFPTILVDARSLEVLDEFLVYVRPVQNPILTPFCTSLTEIQQSMVEGAVLFEEALGQHTEFMRRNSCLPGLGRLCLFITRKRM